MDGERFFLDTCFGLAFLNAKDQGHQAAVGLLPRLQAAREIWTTDAVLTEIGNGGSAGDRQKVAQWISSCYQLANFRVVHISADIFQAALAFYRQHDDKRYSLTDCMSFLVMRREKLTDAVTADRHFDQAGFKALLRR